MPLASGAFSTIMHSISETLARRLALLERRGFLALAVAGGLTWFTRFVRAADSDSAATFKVVVHPKNPSTQITREFLADAFLKRATRWQDGEHLHPVDLEPSSRVRERFSKDVLKRSVAAVRSYWQQQIFSGRQVPPPELDSDAAVMRYVSRHLGGVGYVRGDRTLDGVKVLAVRY